MSEHRSDEGARSGAIGGSASAIGSSSDHGGATSLRKGGSGVKAEHGEALLQVSGLEQHFPVRRGLLQRKVGAVRAVDGIDFQVKRGETFAIVGESGCGKTTTGRMLTRLIEPTGGRIDFDGRDITHLSTGQMRPLRRDMQIIFQDPFSSLNPRHTVGTIVGTPFRLQNIKTEHGTKRAVQDLLALVGLNPEHYNRYPHEFSGGQRQRIGIARALALRPKLIVADEPVSALDVSIQAQVVNLLEDLQNEFDLTYIVIAHDLSVVRHMSDTVAVMYLGKLVEIADRTSLYERPMHPYTVALLSAVPVPNPDRETRQERIRLQGDPPSPLNPPPGCRFHTRCWKAQEICKSAEPPLAALDNHAVDASRATHRVACHFPENVDDPRANVRRSIGPIEVPASAAATAPDPDPTLVDHVDGDVSTADADRSRSGADVPNRELFHD